jgi:hypothetical protein
MTTNGKTDSNATPAGTGGSAATKSETTASGKGADKKKQQQHKNRKANPQNGKKKQTPNVKSTFDCIASGVNPMKGIVIAQGNGNLAG